MRTGSDNTFYVTTPIYYVNAEPHIGHAYSTIVADVIARFYRLAGVDAFFLTGTDEHGDKVVEAAGKAGETVKSYVDRIAAIFRETWPKLNITNDYFIRTTDENHIETVREILTRVYEKGDIYFSEYEGKYCVGCERFYTETELVDDKCPIHLSEPKVIREENYFFRMSKYQGWLIDYINKNPEFIRPERYRNEVLAFLKGPLEDLCISRPKRRLSWGIPLPFDDNYVTYVWFDALINYVSALGYPEGERFRKYWPAAQHIIAKDILKPHGIFWPCMLKAAGIEPYQHLNVHGYWNINAGKMSKSLGNIVKPMDLSSKYGLDAFRYFLLRDMVFGLDSDFSEEALVKRLNSDLANDLGNLVSRSTTMASNYFDGLLPTPEALEEEDLSVRDATLKAIDAYRAEMEGFAFHKALITVWEVISTVNKYIDTTKPWTLAKSDRERLGTVLHTITEAIKVVSVLLWPFMPQSAERIQDQLGYSRVGLELPLEDIGEWGKTKPARPVSKAPGLFPRVTFEEEPEEEKSGLVSLEEFQRLDLRVGTIQKAEEIPGSDKLLKLTIDLGEERTIVAGLAQHYSADELRKKQAIVLANLKPVKLRGVESQGMILAAEDKAGIYLLVPDKETKPGSPIR
ncbi:MAG: methionine--tRNA ligase [Deltaproteobacteria bacterium]|nr:methionine--tRNA ligase [Deltaproteobacteria bacterium]MBW2078172.1 methionine--tRNA ligase [Deltaproteobacteria bacterium]MBW2312318.1 methionine--tRNA ligase [Deltaproteobacteria bacterium]